MPRSFLHRNWRHAPRGDYEGMCSICGVGCARSKLVRKLDGLFYCPDCQPGRDAVTLSRLNAQKRPVYRPRWDGPGMDGRDYGVSPTPETSGVFDATFDGSFE